MHTSQLRAHDVPGIFHLLAETFAPQPAAEQRRDDNTPFTAALRDTSSELTKSNAYTLVGFIGASIVAAGLVYPIAGLGSVLTALALVLTGIGLATFGWTSAWKVLDRLVGPEGGRPAIECAAAPESAPR